MSWRLKGVAVAAALLTTSIHLPDSPCDLTDMSQAFLGLVDIAEREELDLNCWCLYARKISHPALPISSYGYKGNCQEAATPGGFTFFLYV